MVPTLWLCPQKSFGFRSRERMKVHKEKRGFLSLLTNVLVSDRFFQHCRHKRPSKKKRLSAKITHKDLVFYGKTNYEKVTIAVNMNEYESVAPSPIIRTLTFLWPSWGVLEVTALPPQSTMTENWRGILVIFPDMKMLFLGGARCQTQPDK